MRNPIWTVIWVLAVSFAFTGVMYGDNTQAIKRVRDLSHTSGKLGAYKALVIGINDYVDPKIPDLETAVNDARAVAELLKTRYGFQVTLMLDRQATWETMDRALRDLAVTGKPGDSVLIYYAGHGKLDKVYDDGWWIPSDAKVGKRGSYLGNTQVQKAMRKIPARHVLLISDSCYSGTLFGQGRAMPPDITDKYYQNLYNEKSRWGMTSGNKEPVSDSGAGGHSIFAYQLLKALGQNDKPYLSTQEIYTKIAPIVSNNSEQTPICRPVRNTGDQGGEFIFVASVRPSPIPHPEVVQPQDSGASFDDIVQESRTRKEARENWQKWLQAREGEYAQVKRIDQDADIAAELKVEAWGRFLVAVSQDNPYSEKDETLRARAEERMAFWEKAKTTAAMAPRPQAFPGPATELSGKTTWTEPTTGMEFAKIPKGCFQMGSESGESYEKPVHEACVDGFWMGKYEVTQGQWKAIMGSNPSGFDRGNRYPVENVSWNDAQDYVEKLSRKSGKKFRLPTEAEWEYAARGEGKESYAGSDEIDRVAWYDGNSGKSTHPVGQKAPNGFGLYDLSGNVWEWCQDVYDNDAYKKHSRTNPLIANGKSLQVLRGGSFDRPAVISRAAYRYGNLPGLRIRSFGLRLVLLPGR